MLEHGLAHGRPRKQKPLMGPRARQFVKPVVAHILQFIDTHARAWLRSWPRACFFLYLGLTHG